MGCNQVKLDRKQKDFTAEKDIFDFQKRIAMMPPEQLAKFLSQEHCTASSENINFYYKMDKVLGHGAFGTVKLATLRSQKDDPSPKVFAIKSVSKERVIDKIDLLIRELKIMKMLDHPNIIKFFEIYQDDMYIHYVMEYCSGGDLLQFVIDRQFLYEDKAARIMQKLLSAVDHMHSKKICHRDLKPENILFDTAANSYRDSQVKIIDFGLSKILDFAIKEEDKKLSYVGTPLYVAPEVVNNVEYGTAVDCWSLGVIMYIMLSGIQPFGGDDVNQVYKKIISGRFDFPHEYWSEVSPEAVDLVRKLLEKNPKKRISCKEALKHPWIDKNYLNENKKKYERKLNHSRTIISNMRHYNGEEKLKKEAMKIIINHQLSQDQLKKMLETFKAYDIDKNGEIGFDDLYDAMKKSGVQANENEIFELLKKFQTEETVRNPKKLTLNYYQFIEATLDLGKFLNREKLWAVFQHFDPDNKGYITLENIKEVAAREGRTLPDSEIKVLATEVGDKLNFVNFCKLLNPEINIDQENAITTEKK